MTNWPIFPNSDSYRFQKIVLSFAWDRRHYSIRKSKVSVIKIIFLHISLPLIMHFLVGEICSHLGYIKQMQWWNKSTHLNLLNQTTIYCQKKEHFCNGETIVEYCCVYIYTCIYTLFSLHTVRSSMNIGMVYDKRNGNHRKIHTPIDTCCEYDHKLQTGYEFYLVSVIVEIQELMKM